MNIKDREIRGQDAQGSGEYLAKRGTRLHQGIDFISEVDEEIGSVCCGTVSKIGYPYQPTDPKRGHLRYVQVTDQNNIKVRIFYIDPTVDIGAVVHEGQTIGISQDLTKIYPGITQHIHFETKKNSRYTNPLDYLDLDD